MPCLVTTHVGDTLKTIVQEYYKLNAHLSPTSIEDIARLNNVSTDGMLPPFKVIALPDSSSTGMCNAVDYEAATLASELSAKGNDPLNQLLSSDKGEELLAALEFTEMLDADSTTKTLFGGSLGASTGLYSEFIKAYDDYKNKLSKYTAAPARERRLLRRQIASAARNVQTMFAKIVTQILIRRNTAPNKIKLLPHSTMTSINKYGKRSVYLKDSSDIRRIRWVTRGAKVLGAGALLLDFTLAAKNIKLAHEDGRNSTRVAFEEAGGISAEIAVGAAAAYGAGLTFTGVTSLLPFAIIPGVGLIIVITAGAVGALAGSVYGKKIGAILYDNMVKSPVTSPLLSEINM